MVCSFSCDLCGAGYVGYTTRHLFQRKTEHKGQSSSIGKDLSEAHGNEDLPQENNFRVLKKCQSKFNILIYEILCIKKLCPNLDIQSDSIHAKLFV